MGLDVYLRKCPDRAAAKALEDKYEEKSNELYKNAKGDAELQRAREKCTALAHKMGLAEYGRHPTRQDIEHASEKYPDHMFKVGYFRSSYNEGGINRVCDRFGIPSLYDIFQPDEKEYEITPDWDKARDAVQMAIARMRAVAVNGYDITKVDFVPAPKKPVSNESEALALFEQHLKRERGDTSFLSYENLEGQFMLNEPMRVKAILKGTKVILGRVHPVMYVVYDAKDKFEWYVQALEIVQETIEFVLGQPDKEAYYLAWSA